MPDLYGPCAPILKTLTRDPITARTIDFKAGDEGQSLWDEINSSQGKFFTLGKDGNSNVADNEDVGSWYKEADALEDVFLFPEHPGGKAFFKGNRPAVDRHTKSVPDFARFVADESTTDEETDSEDSEDYGVYGSGELENMSGASTPSTVSESRTSKSQEPSLPAEHDGQSVAGDETPPSPPSPFNPELLFRKPGSLKKAQTKKKLTARKRPSASLAKARAKTKAKAVAKVKKPSGTTLDQWNSESNEESTDDDSESYEEQVDLIDLFDKKALARMSPESREDLVVRKGWHDPYKQRFARDPGKDFTTFMDREKSKRESIHYNLISSTKILTPQPSL